MDQFWLELVKGSGIGAVVGMIVWWNLRDHARILRSIDLRVSKVLERQRVTPIRGVPILNTPRAHKRQRSVHDSDMAADDNIAIPRTSTDDDMDDK